MSTVLTTAKLPEDGKTLQPQDSEPQWWNRVQKTKLPYLRCIFSESFDFIDHADFHQSAFEAKLFEELPAIEEPDTSWYRPVMDVPTSASLRQASSLLLSTEQEQTLFMRFNYCRYRVWLIKAEIADQSNPPLSQADDMIQWYDRAEYYRHKIAKTNLALVLAMAKRTRSIDMDFADLVSEGNMALLRAVDKFDVARGFKFSTYACRAILKAFSRSGMKHTRYRQMFPADFDPKMERSDYMERCREGHEQDCANEVLHILNKNTADLTKVEKQVIEHRFAIGEKLHKEPNAEPLTLEEVGRLIGVTKERVRQIQNKALKKIRVTLEGDYLR
jgi:RNA polymerase sigma factor (sigma-70 family)